jgi:protein O-GlcNAc transferase
MQQQMLAQAIAHHQAGRLSDAEAIYRRALAENATDADALHLLGVVLHQSGRSVEGYALVTRASVARPGEARIWNNLGEIARSIGRRNEAESAFRRAIELQRDYPAAWSNLGLALSDLGRFDEAVDALQLATALKPDYPKAFGHLGMALQATGRRDEALAACRTAVQLSPRSPEAHNNLGNVLRGMNLLDEAIDEYRETIRLKPDHAPAYHNLGEALAREGDIDAALDCYRQALAIRPDYLLAHQTMLFMMHYSERLTADEIFQAHLRWADQYEKPLRGSIEPHSNDRSPDRRLRVGYVSPDFRRHPVGFFMRPIFANHDPAVVEIFAYSDAVQSDATTNFIRSRAHVWRDTFTLSDEQFARQVREDQIDILVDLTLHMAHSRLLAFARKPTPVQATYLGYAHSTGLAAMDYKITDPHLDPPGMSERFHTEKLVRLPETNFCCEPDPDAPEVGELPARRNGYVTFASFNTLMKITPGVVETWSRLLREVPSAKLMIVAGGLAGERTRERMRDRFAAHGITADRLELIEQSGVAAGFAALQRADIALDTFPYAGGTTTCNSLWMGAAVITLAGASPIARQGVSFLTNVGLPDLIADSREQYIAIAAALAGDLDRLAQIRRSLRDRMRASPILDGPRFARNLESAYRAMWRTWCEGGR